MHQRRLILFFLLAMSAKGHALEVRGGDISSGGGDALVMAFTMAGQKACEYLTNTGGGTPVDPHSFCRAVVEIKVTSEDLTILNGVEVDAINTPAHKTIVLSQKRNKGKSLAELKSLAVHEYLSVMGVEDSNYQVSGPIADQISKEIDYFPVRACEISQEIQVGTLLPNRLKERSLLKVIYRTDFPKNQPVDFWFDLGDEFPFVRDAETGHKIEFAKILVQLKNPQTQICRPLKDREGRSAGEICFKAEGRRDLIKDYVTSPDHDKTLVRLGLSKFRNLSSVEFISPADQNPSPGFSSVSGYIDEMGFRGTHQLFTKRIFNNDQSRVSRTALKTWGAEMFKISCN